MKRFLISSLILVVAHSLGLSQSKWSLQKCVDQARTQSLTIQRAKLSIDQASINTTQAIHSKYPRLNANANYGLNFGRTIDPVTNDFESQSIGNNSLGLSTGAILWNGGSIRNTLSQSKLNLQSAKLDAEQISDDIALTVVQYYLAILFAQDRLDNARIQVQSTTQQLDQIDKLIAAGSRPEGDRLDILAQRAGEEQNIISSENTVESNKILLKQLLRLPIDQVFDIERPASDILQPSITENNLAAIYNHAISNRPDIQSADLRVKSAEYGVQIAKSNITPTVSIGGNMNSLFSSLGRRIDGFSTVRIPQTVIFNGQAATIEIEQDIPKTSKNPYFNQLNENLGYGLGLSMSVPIYNNYTAKAGVSRAEIAVQDAKISSEQSKETLKNNIQTALNDLRTGAQQYAAASRTVEARDLAYQNLQKKFDLGASNTYDLLTAKNRLDISRTEQLLAKYDYIFRTKVVDYYLGRPISLN